MPSVYELMPQYACLDTPEGMRTLTPADLSGFDLDLDLMSRARGVHDALAAAENNSSLRAQVGVAQPTLQSMRITDGEPSFHYSVAGADRQGDGTVYRDAAAPADCVPDYVAQRHGRLAATDECLEYLRAVLTETRLGPPMGTAIGMDLPDVVQAGHSFTVDILAAGQQPVSCALRDADTGDEVDNCLARPSGDRQAASLTAHRTGIYVVEATGSGATPVAETVVAIAPDA
jgi:hypothetical protein